MCEIRKQEYPEIISMEEYLWRRKKIKEESGKYMQREEKSSVFAMAELFV